jgi:glycosyltransferase involved in cell wall biosynthesis
MYSDVSHVKLSVCIISFNQEKYIERAIESVFQQVTNFDFEIIICDDCSTDSTPQILSNMLLNFRGRYNLILNEKNIGVASNFSKAIFQCKGKYIALLEGDDYWVDNSKLQKQVDFLESNPKFSMSYTNVIDFYEEKGIEILSGSEHPEIISINYLLKIGWFIRTATIVFKRDLIVEFPRWFYEAYSTDYILHLLLASKGDIQRLPIYSAVYRRNSQGVSTANLQIQIKRWEQKINLLTTIDEFFKFKFQKEIKFQKAEIYSSIIIGILKLKHNYIYKLIFVFNQIFNPCFFLICIFLYKKSLLFISQRIKNQFSI